MKSSGRSAPSSTSGKEAIAPEPSPPLDLQMSRLHVARTSVAALTALLVARVVTLPEPYWATITALVVMQSSLIASWTVSWKRLVGTAIGAVVGGAMSTLFPPSALLFAVSLFATGLLCLAVGLDRVAYRFTGITLAIITLVARNRPAWITAAHRFAEVSLGIAVALVITAVWPEKPAARPNRPSSA
jgi:uncharacterized membrane protein YccC